MNLTPLNRWTTQKYNRCRAAGTHRAGAILTRESRPWYADGNVYFAVCDSCGVPVTGQPVIFRLHKRKFAA